MATAGKCGGDYDPAGQSDEPVTLDGRRVHCEGNYTYYTPTDLPCNTYTFGTPNFTDEEVFPICVANNATYDEIIAECENGLKGHAAKAWWAEPSARSVYCAGSAGIAEEKTEGVVTGYHNAEDQSFRCDPLRINAILPFNSDQHEYVAVATIPEKTSSISAMSFAAATTASEENYNWTWINNKDIDSKDLFYVKDAKISYDTVCNNGDECVLLLDSMYIKHENKSVKDVTISELTCINAERMVGSWNRVTGEAAVTPSELYCQHKQDGEYTSYGIIPNGILYGTLLPDSNIARFWGELVNVSDKVIEYNFEGTFKYTKPSAEFSVEDTTFECDSFNGKLVDFNASDSHGGGSEIQHKWILDSSVVATDEFASIELPVGESEVHHVIQTDRNVEAVASKTITVVDTTAPEIVAPQDLTITACGENETVYVGAPVATDACSAVAVSGYVVEKDGAAIVPIEIIDNEVVVAPGEYTIEWTAVDGQGNVSVAMQTLDVNAGIRATNSINIRDYAVVQSTMLNSGSYWVEVGANAQTSNIVSAGSVSLRNFATVDGNITTNGQVQEQLGSLVSGSVTETAGYIFSDLGADDLSSVFFTNSGNDINYNSGAVETLTPGHYPRVTVNSGATIILTAGDYFFKGLTVNSNTFIIDGSKGPVQIFVKENLEIRAPLSTPDGDVADLFVGYVGQNQATIDASFNGTLIAPNSRLVLGQNAPLVFRGRFVASDIVVARGSSVVCDPFITED